MSFFTRVCKTLERYQSYRYASQETNVDYHETEVSICLLQKQPRSFFFPCHIHACIAIITNDLQLSSGYMMGY